MKVNNNAYDLSLNDCTELRKLIIENPDLPLLVFAGEDACSDDDWGYSQCKVNSCEIKELTLCGDGYWCDEDDCYEYLSNKLSDDIDYPEYANMTNKEYAAMVEKKVDEAEAVRTIVIYVG